MNRKSAVKNYALGNAIKNRREELGMTLEEAALNSGVGIQTFMRYESGESIRADKVKGLLSALKWNDFPKFTKSPLPKGIDLNKYKSHVAWSRYLFENFGVFVAISFTIGSDLLLDSVSEDLQALATMPKDSHIGQLNVSMLDGLLPEQFLTSYNYEFLYRLSCTISKLRSCAQSSLPIIAHNVLDELALYLIMEESTPLMEIIADNLRENELEEFENWDGWAFDIFDDIDIITFLYSNVFLDIDHPYHFNNWSVNQFYCD